MADVLLTHSYHLPYDRKQVRKMQPYPPLGTLYAAAVLREHGVSVAVFDAMLQEPECGFREALRVHRPKIVAIYEDDFNFLTKMCLTRMRELAWWMIEEGRRHGARVLVHGSDATDHSDEYLRQGCDFVLIGEAEYILLEAVQSILRNSDRPTDFEAGSRQFDSRCASRILQTHCRVTDRQLSLPLPARDLIDLTKYQASWRNAHNRFSLNLVASRGCPFRCNWCAKPIFGDSYRVREAREVAEEMSLLQKRYGAEHLWFADDIFALNPRWIQEFAEQVESRRCAIPFKIQARADRLKATMVHALKRAGCEEVWMGVESGSQKILNAMDKGLRVEEIVAAREYLKQEGIRACYFLQFGYPGESWRDICETIDLVRETRPDDIGVSFSYPLPNTRFYDRVQQSLGKKRNWSDSDDLCVMFKGAYTDGFYRAVRDALHAEVDGWQRSAANFEESLKLKNLWWRVEELEPLSRNPDATEFAETSCYSAIPDSMLNQTIVPVRNLSMPAGKSR